MARILLFCSAGRRVYNCQNDARGRRKHLQSGFSFEEAFQIGGTEVWRAAGEIGAAGRALMTWEGNGEDI